MTTDEKLPIQQLSEARPGNIVPGSAFDRLLTDREFLEKARKAIHRRRGLIHGKLRDGHSRRVCALGSMLGQFVGCSAPTELAAELQAVNDSVPKATPEKRRMKVLAWIDDKLRKSA